MHNHCFNILTFDHPQEELTFRGGGATAVAFAKF